MPTTRLRKWSVGFIAVFVLALGTAIGVYVLTHSKNLSSKISNTSISGTIIRDQVWEGDIRVTGDVTVLKRATLTILPGTTITVAAMSDDQRGGNDHPNDPPFPLDPDRKETQSTLITINGTLHAVGTPDQRILFTSDSANPTTYDWDGLFISHGRLEYATVEYARYNSVQVSSDVTIAKSTIRNALECCLCIGHAKPISPQILNNDIYNCGHEGIDYAGGSGLIKGNTFHLENPEIQPDPSIGRGGIVVYENAYPVIEENTFERLANAVLFLPGPAHEKEAGKQPIVRKNIIRNNDVSVNVEPGFPSADIVLEDNQLIGNKKDDE